MKKKTGKRIAGITAFLLGIASLGLTAMATAAPYIDGPESNLWLSVVELPNVLVRVSVTVPISYGFVVVGSVNPADDGEVTSNNGKILLPNVRVKATYSSPGSYISQDYALQITGSARVPLKNYSTDVRQPATGPPITDPDDPDLKREGLPVAVRPFVHSVTQNNNSFGNPITHEWKTSLTSPAGDPALFKYYRMGISVGADTKWFATEKEVSYGSKRYTVNFLDESLLLPAPLDVPTNGWTAGGIAFVPSVFELDIAVEVGGKQNQYDTAEESVKVGEIGWQITPGVLPPIVTP